MSAPEQDSRRLWTFPDGMLGGDDSVKGFAVEAADGQSGTVAWASYAPGESCLVVSLRHHLHESATSFRRLRSSVSMPRNGKSGSA